MSAFKKLTDPEVHENLPDSIQKYGALIFILVNIIGFFTIIFQFLKINGKNKIRRLRKY